MSKLILPAFSLILGFALSILLVPDKVIEQPIFIERKIILRDTIFKSIPSEPLLIYKIRMKIIKKTDTIIKFVPFIAKIDTIIKYDTIKAEYEFPENLFSLEIRKKPDSLMIKRIREIKYIKEEESWWVKPVWIVGGMAVGVLAGMAAKGK